MKLDFHVKKNEGRCDHVPPMKAYMGSGGIAPVILNLGARRRKVVNFTPQPFYLRGRTAVPTE
jgi:hypothetical protein